MPACVRKRRLAMVRAFSVDGAGTTLLDLQSRSLASLCQTCASPALVVTTAQDPENACCIIPYRKATEVLEQCHTVRSDVWFSHALRNHSCNVADLLTPRLILHSAGMRGHDCRDA